MKCGQKNKPASMKCQKARHLQTFAAAAQVAEVNHSNIEAMMNSLVVNVLENFDTKLPSLLEKVSESENEIDIDSTTQQTAEDADMEKGEQQQTTSTTTTAKPTTVGHV